MRLFRSTWLRRILPFLLPVLLSASPLDYIAHGGDGKGEVVIHAEQVLSKISGQMRQLQIKYGFDVVHVSVVPIVTKKILIEYIQGTSFDPLSIDLLTYPDRGPPRLITIL